MQKWKLWMIVGVLFVSSLTFAGGHYGGNFTYVGPRRAVHVSWGGQGYRRCNRCHYRGHYRGYVNYGYNVHYRPYCGRCHRRGFYGRNGGYRTPVRNFLFGYRPYRWTPVRNVLFGYRR